LRTTELWFSSSNQDKDYGQKQNLTECNKVIQDIYKNAPIEITRSVRSLATRNNWKADEWKCWLFYWSPIVMFDKLPTTYYNTWILFIKAILILCKHIILLTDYTTASQYLEQVLHDYEQQYGKSNMVSNMHLLTHLPACVKYWGPLWVCFPFEKFLGFITQFVFSTKNPVLSFCLASQLYQAYIKQHLQNPTPKRANTFQINNQLQVQILKKTKLAITPNGIANITGMEVYSTKKIRLYTSVYDNNGLFLSTYCSPKRDSSCVAFNFANQKKYGRITSIFCCICFRYINSNLCTTTNISSCQCVLFWQFISHILQKHH